MPLFRNVAAAVAIGLVTSVAVFTSIGCREPEGEFVLAQPDMELFASEVYPVLLRDCGTAACHGSRGRFFCVVGPGRVRLSSEQEPLDRATPDEISTSYQCARGMIDTTGHPERSMLLRKPLAQSAGGATHSGQDAFGRNVYSSTQDESYALIARWVRTATFSKEPKP